MAHCHGDIEFHIAVKGAFVAPRLWFIHAAIEYCPWLGSDDRQRVRPEARIELMRRVITETRRGWHLGAGSVRLFVEGDHQVAGLFEVLDRESVPAMVV